MPRWMSRRRVLLLVAGGASAALVWLLAVGRRAGRRAEAEAGAGGRTNQPPQWPAFEPNHAHASEPAPEPDWLQPVDGQCPIGYPIKANSNSHIYHLPGGRFYDRPIAQRCYATESAAQRDGYRRAKNSPRGDGHDSTGATPGTTQMPGDPRTAAG